MKTGPAMMALVLLAVLLLAGCRPAESTPNPQSGIKIEMVVTPDPPTTGDATLLLHITDNGQDISGGKVNIRGDMSHAGMMPVFREAIVLENGQTTVPFNWSMGGDWFVEVTVMLPDGRTSTEKFDYSVTTK